MKWMMQKDLLGQDIFLLGRPGPGRRTLAQQYLQLTQREMEYVSLSRDTTESDLKQRREIIGGTAFYCDQSAVEVERLTGLNSQITHNFILAISCKGTIHLIFAFSLVQDDANAWGKSSR